MTAAPGRRVETLPVVVLLDDVRSLYNVGAFFRTADAVGAERLVLAGITGHPPNRQIAKTALGAEEQVAWEAAASASLKVEELRRAGYEIAVLETGLHSVDLFEWRPAFPVCVVLGHEVEGVRPSLVEAADVLVRIPMRGTKRSLNVATAGGVVLFELLLKYAADHDRV
jgi:23S rRNA (guanosine2251-2'-O)-methyltransferase